MKTSVWIIIVGLVIASIFGGLYVANVIKNIEDQKAMEEWRKLRESIMHTLVKEKKCEEIGGTWNVDHCRITQETFDSNKLTCDPGPVLEDGVCSSHGLSLVIQPKTSEVDDFEKTWGGPGNRHPAFLGYDIPEICTEDMIKHLVKYSSMFDRNEPYYLDWIGLDERIDREDFDMCVKELLELNPKEIENEK